MYHVFKEGWIEVIAGCMFAGKTEELIRRIKVLEFAKKNILVFKPTIDDRYSKDEVTSHAGSAVKSVVVDNAKDILNYVTDDTDVVAIDEANFFGEDIVWVCEQLADNKKRVIVAGLNTDFRGEPFSAMPILLTKAELVTKLVAVCSVCGAPATRTQRLVNGKPAKYSDPIILVGASESYEPRCRHCHQVVDKPNNI